MQNEYQVLNDNILLEKVETNSLVIAGQDEDPNAAIWGDVVLQPSKVDYDFTNGTAMFIRGQSRKVTLEGKEYFLVKKENILLWRQK